MNNENNPSEIQDKTYIPLTPFKGWVLENFPFIEANFDAITNYELICLLVKYLNEVIANQNSVEELGTDLVNGYNALLAYVNNYFDNLDVQEEINNKLDEMAQTGILTDIIKDYVDPLYQGYVDITNGRINQIDTKVDALASGSPLAATNTSGMTDTSRIYVNTTDGYWYFYDGDSWEQGGVYQASVDNDTTTLNSNMINPISYTDLCLLQGSVVVNTGVISHGNTNRVFTFDYIEGYHTFSVPTGYLIMMVIYYDKDTHAFVSGSTINLQTTTLGSSDNVYRIVIKKADNSDFTPLDLDRSQRVKKLMIEDTLNLFNTSTLEQGAIELNGTETSNANRLRTKSIYHNKLIILPKGYKIKTIAYYDEDDDTFDSYSLAFQNQQYAEIGKSGCYARFTISKDTDTSPIVPMDIMNINNQINVLSGKKLLVFGDSIAYGNTSTNQQAYGEYIASKNSMTLSKQSVSGAFLVSNQENSIYTKVEDFISNSNDTFDYILLEGGCNDMTINSPLGTIIDGYDTTSCVTTTISGSLEKIISDLRNKWPQANIIFVTNHKMSSRSWTIQNNYYDRFIEICNKWGIGVADIFNKGQLSSYISSMATTCFPESETSPTGYDRTHPNPTGYKNFYCPIIEATMIKYNHYQ